MKNEQNYSQKVVFIIIGVYFIYALLFIWNTSYEIEGSRYFSLLDDAMISMRYAENFAKGNGPYFNSGGEKVEGYTNPLWMLIMTGVHLLPVEKQYTSLFMQLLGAVLMAFNLFFVAKLAHLMSKGKKYVVYTAVLLTASFLPLNVWSLGGMEVAALVPLTTAAAYYLYLSVKHQRHYYQIIWLTALGAALRPDYLLLMTAFYFVAVSFVGTRNKKFENIFLTALFLVIFLMFSFRLYYYDDFLPNTYYLKMTGYTWYLRITRGFFSFISLGYIWFWLLLFWLYKDKRANYHSYIFIFVIPAVMIVYNIYIGGDAWDWWNGANRFICTVLPLIFIIFADFEFEHLIKYETLATPGKTGELRFPKFVVLLTVLFVNVFILFNSWEEVFLLKEPLLMKDNKKMTILALEAERILPKDATATLATAGVAPYYLDRKIIDILGKNDKHIARIQGRVKKGFGKYDGFQPGHNKWDYSWSIGHLQPYAVLQLWTHHEEALPYLSRNYELVNAGHFHFFIKLNKNH